MNRELLSFLAQSIKVDYWTTYFEFHVKDRKSVYKLERNGETKPLALKQIELKWVSIHSSCILRELFVIEEDIFISARTSIGKAVEPATAKFTPRTLLRCASLFKDQENEARLQMLQQTTARIYAK